MIKLDVDAPLAVLQVSSAGVVMEGMGSLERVLGAPASALLGRSLGDLPTQQEGDPRTLRELVAACRDGQAWSGMVQLQWPDAPIAHELLLKLVPAAGGGGQVWGMRCPTGALESRLRTARQDGQRDLILGLSHNLNNILTGVLAPAQLLLEAVPDPGVQQDVKDILSATHRARTLLLELKQAVQIEAVPAEPVLLAATIATVLDRETQSRPDPGGPVRVEVAPLGADVAVLAHAETLAAIIERILHNAAEARPRSGRIEVAVQVEPDEIVVEISDDGEGITDAVRQRVFEPLFSTKSTVGSGLSLATARAQLRHWGGDLVLHSAPRQGTRARLRLRRAVLVPVAAVPPQPRGRVLIVEDDPLIARAMQRLLGREHEVTVAHSGLVALEMFVPDAYDVALVDLSMPELSGEGVARVLRRQDPPLSLLLLTGWLIQPDDPLMLVFDGLLQKPVMDLARARERVRHAADATRVRRREHRPVPHPADERPSLLR